MDENRLWTVEVSFRTLYTNTGIHNDLHGVESCSGEELDDIR